jgi:hypothetical protein
MWPREASPRRKAHRRDSGLRVGTIRGRHSRGRVQAPQAGDYSVEVLVSGAPGSRIEIAGPRDTISVTIPEGNDHWGNNWNKIPVPGWLTLPQGISAVTVRSPNPAGTATNKNH